MTAEQRSQFDKFNKACKYVIEVEDPRQAPCKIWATRDGSVTRDYECRYPWVCLKFPNVADRLLIFQHEYINANPASGTRLDLEHIKRYSTKNSDEVR